MKAWLDGVVLVSEMEMERLRRRAGGDPEKLARIRYVSPMFKGYDIESFDRVIEVKSFRIQARLR